MEDSKRQILHKMAEFIVNKRSAFLVLFIIAVIYCAGSIDKVKINQDITSYLPAGTETKRGLELMDSEFANFGSAQILVSNITLKAAQTMARAIEHIDGVYDVAFDGSADHYKDASALFSVSFAEDGESAGARQAMTKIRQLLAGYDAYISSSVGNDLSAVLNREMSVIMAVAVVVIALVLLFTSKSYAEILVFLIVFPVAAVLNMGTNYWFDEVSFVTNSIAIILQLALAIDYSIILCHRFMDEMETRKPKEAVIHALAEAIVEISSSSLTTISGLAALAFMQFQLGRDMGQVLIKGIFFSLITVFLLMPGVLMLFSRLIQKTRHRSFVPGIRGFGRLVLKFRYVLSIAFLVLAGLGIYYSGKCEYVFSENIIDTRHPSAEKIAEDKIAASFGVDNVVAVLVPRGNYQGERRILDLAGELPRIKTAAGLANVEIEDQYVLTDELTPRQFAELTEVPLEMVYLLYRAYGLNYEEYGVFFQELDEYQLPLIDVFLFLCEQRAAGVINLDDEEQNKALDEMQEMLQRAKNQLSGEQWSRLVFVTDLPVEGAETFALLDELRRIAAHTYGEDVILVGNSTNARDLGHSFSADNNLISVLTAVFVLLVLMFTFRSTGLPIILIAVIQGSIWINFSFPYLTGNNLFFISYLIVSAIQMGATIDYAIVISNRYQELKQELPKAEAVVEALNQSFATIFTSGSILTIAGFLIAELTTYAIIGSIGLALGRGTLISLILVMTVLPAILYLGDGVIEKTAFGRGGDDDA